MAARIRNQIRANVLGFLALFLVLSTGSALALNGSDTVFSDDIVNGEVKAPDLGANAVNTAKVTDNSLTGADINESTLAGLWKVGGNAGTSGSNFLGTTDNKPLNLRVNNARGLRIEPASDGTNQSPNVIGGIADNQVAAGAYSATIGGGGRSDPGNPATANKVTDDFGTVSGGARNLAGDGAGSTSDASFATVPGGVSNTASGLGSTAVGGVQNNANGDYSLAAGRNATATHDGSFVWADSRIFGFTSTAPDQFSVRATGGTRFVSGISAATPTSGLELPAGTSGWSTVAPGQPFDVRLNGSRGLRIDPASDGTNQSPNVIGGIADNQVTPGVHSAVIAGGGRGTPSSPATANRVTDHQGTIGGGANNQAGDDAGTVGDATLATVGGGGNNKASGELSTVGGGFFDIASGPRATVGGGNNNTASGDESMVAGGLLNTASGPYDTVGGGVAGTANGTGDTVSGGAGNTAEGGWATVGGGQANDATEANATVGGGTNNTASELSASVAGGSSNVASGFSSSVPGGAVNTAQGDYSLAAGRDATANHNGAFVWADSSSFDFASTAQNQFSVRATGGARFVSAINGSTGAPTAGVTLAPGGGSWASLSDQASKTVVTPVSGREVLRKLASVPISEWSYRAEGPSVRHIGPMAQDLSRAFGVGEDPRHITSVDADGISLAAIKGLQSKLRAERLRRHALERHLNGLEARLAALEREGTK